jgi:hypothetical protein
MKIVFEITGKKKLYILLLGKKQAFQITRSKI